MTKIAIVQLDDRSDEELGALIGLVQRNMAYAEARGYGHIFVRNPDPSIPVYWAKVYAVKKVLESGFDIVAWLDTDVVIHDFSRRIESLFEQPEQAFVYAQDVPVWVERFGFNAGVFFCRGDFGRALLADWWSLLSENMHLWTKTDGKWACSTPGFGSTGYEQGAFVENLLPRFSGTPQFREVPWTLLQSPFPVPESFTLHFHGALRQNVAPYLAYIGVKTNTPGTD